MTMQYTPAQIEFHVAYKERQARLYAAAKEPLPTAPKLLLIKRPSPPTPSPSRDIWLVAFERAMANAILEDTVVLDRKSTEPSFKEIQRLIAVHHGVGIEDLFSPRRTANIVRARQIAMWCIWVLKPNASLPEIGRRFGGKNHTTILHAVRKMGRLHGVVGRAAAEPIARQILTDAGYIWPEQQTEGEGE